VVFSYLFPFQGDFRISLPSSWLYAALFRPWFVSPPFLESHKLDQILSLQCIANRATIDYHPAEADGLVIDIRRLAAGAGGAEGIPRKSDRALDETNW